MTDLSRRAILTGLLAAPAVLPAAKIMADAAAKAEPFPTGGPVNAGAPYLVGERGSESAFGGPSFRPAVGRVVFNDDGMISMVVVEDGGSGPHDPPTIKIAQP